MLHDLISAFFHEDVLLPYADDVAELKERQGEIWQLLKSSQSEEL